MLTSLFARMVISSPLFLQCYSVTCMQIFCVHLNLNIGLTRVCGSSLLIVLFSFCFFMFVFWGHNDGKSNSCPSIHTPIRGVKSVIVRVWGRQEGFLLWLFCHLTQQEMASYSSWYSDALWTLWFVLLDVDKVILEYTVTVCHLYVTLWWLNEWSWV